MEIKQKEHQNCNAFPKEEYVLILDDLWKSFSLDKVGIPEPSISNGCKLVLTTRSLEVWRKMECRAVKVELLTEDEALNLFMSKVEEHQTVLTPKVKENERKVAKEYARLPLAITTIAGSMRGVNDIRE
ncbi:Disease resistance protein SUMM2 [Camellia lanceoleosa]|nr:Disease resistance protein SUMM2 [Camellia lanceoleosa]